MNDSSNLAALLLFGETIIVVSFFGSALALRGEPKWTFRLNMALLALTAVAPHILLFHRFIR
ncbi:MAG: hypothetical protein ACM3NH_00615 [Candidatus Saccharibacteria bacterium]